MLGNVGTTAFARVASALVVAAALFSVSSASALERWVHIGNTGSTEIFEVYIKHIDSNRWGPDLLGSDYIDVGDSMTVDPLRTQGYCRFDIKLVFADGSETFAWDENLCEITDLYADEWDYEVFAA
jgi:hypothetical protein